VSDMPAEKDRQPTVLLLDDDIDVLAANARYLRINGIQVIVADRADVALQRLADECIDVIITDLRMPDMDGIAFVEKVRETLPLVPVLFFSGYAEVNDVVEAMRLGATDFLEKPVSPEDLMSSLNYILSRHLTPSVDRLAFNLDESLPFKQRVRLYEKHLIEACLARHQGQIHKVLDELNINRRTLNDKMAKLGIHRQRRDEQ